MKRKPQWKAAAFIFAVAAYIGVYNMTHPVHPAPPPPPAPQVAPELIP